jgi:uncharacterized membrane protein (DUF2068 family)
MSVNQRPSGVTALAILEISLGVLLFTGFMFAFFPTLTATHFHFRPVRGAVLLVLATVDFILAYCLWNGKSWAWITALVFAFLGIVFSGFMLFIRPALGGMASLIIELLILYYLMQPKVQRHFGRSKQLQKQQV